MIRPRPMKTWTLFLALTSLLDLTVFWSKYYSYYYTDKNKNEECMNDLYQCNSNSNYWENGVKYTFLIAYACNALFVATRNSSFLSLKTECENNKDKDVTEKTSLLKAFTSFFYNFVFYVILLPENITRNYSVLYMVMWYVYDECKMEGAEVMVELKRASRKKVAFFALRNPLTFYNGLRRVVVYIRWLHFLVPLIGSLNKLIGNVSDLRKKWKQRQKRKHAKLAREKMINAMTMQQRSSNAALTIQRLYRGRQARRYYLERVMSNKAKNYNAVIIIQHKFRKIKARQKSKRRVFDTLEQKQQQSISLSERKYFLKLKNELYRDRITLLIRPNTKFSVIWKVLAVSYILLEVITIALPPFLTGSTSPITLQELVQLISITLSYYYYDASPQTTAKPISFKSQLFHIIHSSLIQLHPDTKTPSSIASINSAASSIQINSNSQEHFIQYFVYAIDIICFLDVPITFFTGELHPKTGSLIPKHFIKRWILPGLMLQLIVNPAMKDIHALAVNLGILFIRIDPARFLRWHITLFIPLWNLFVSCFYHSILNNITLLLDISFL